METRENPDASPKRQKAHAKNNRDPKKYPPALSRINSTPCSARSPAKNQSHHSSCSPRPNNLGFCECEFCHSTATSRARMARSSANSWKSTNGPGPSPPLAAAQLPTSENNKDPGRTPLDVPTLPAPSAHPPHEFPPAKNPSTSRSRTPPHFLDSKAGSRTP